MQKNRLHIYFTINFILLITLLLSKVALAENNQPPVPVQAVSIKFTTWQPTIRAIGTLSAEQGIMVRPEIGGRIKEIYFRSGTPVEKGAQLIQLDQSILKAQLESYKANLALSQITYNRNADLFKTHSIAKAEMDRSIANLQADKANVEHAQALLNQTEINAPFAGRLGLRLISIGDYVQAGQDIVTLQQTDPINVDFSLGEVYLSKIKVGQKVGLTIGAYPNETFTGKVSAINSIINTSNRSLVVRAQIDNKEGKLIPGGFAEVTLYAGQPQQTIQLPITAIVYSDQENYVYKIVDKKAVKTTVKVGERTNNQAQILSGLNPNDIVVTVGQQKLMEGATVAITPNK